jgi:hypothetical protein
LDPERYVERFRNKINLLEYDFVVMPMFETHAFFFLEKISINQMFILGIIGSWVLLRSLASFFRAIRKWLIEKWSFENEETF